MYIEDVATKTIHYIYDVDDNKHHVMKVEKIDNVTSGDAYIRLVRAIGACPPESVGGSPTTPTSSQPLQTPSTNCTI